MKNKLIVALLVVALGLVFSGVSYAGPNDKGHSGPYKGGPDAVLKQLNLSQQQETQVKELQKSDREKAKEYRLNLTGKRKELISALDEPKTDMAKVKALTAELKNISGSMIDQRVNSALKMKEILTPEQYRKFSDTIKAMRKDNFIKGREGFKRDLRIGHEEGSR